RSRRQTPAGSRARPRSDRAASLLKLLQELLRLGRRLGVRVLFDDVFQRGLGLVRLLQADLNLGLGQQVGGFSVRVTGLGFVLGLFLRPLFRLRIVLLGHLLAAAGPGPFFIPALLGVCREEDGAVLLIGRRTDIHVPAPRLLLADLVQHLFE